ncbi:MAG TPA: (deoxy)nucleoside triphosphate pyrophosphohydrolase [Polyangiaceae bacterium]|nr:(deoxy)nucleoside triphosphate pyrophosphohydrolase [Polyangiaceae bacterium]
MKSKPPVPGRPLSVVGAAILRGDRCLVGQRPRGGSFGERWEFPGGKVEADETPEQALVREIGEELGLDIVVGDFAGRGQVHAGGRDIVLDVYFAEIREGEPEAREHLALRWIEHHDIESLSWADADLPILPVLRGELLRRAADEPSE